ncbi:sugar kinase [Microbacterium sp. zg.Y625]|uniref:sugar kinase n=1 Tax=Microbacterium jiangjiandongii TaxID=3049071 RepID=UPI00214C1C51|nr:MULTISPECIES: sugar kinase [unclassified Microbacterium]MCR2792386.1 sugar kinase [Microbacterium sp. zg.Y625]WIM26383.1 sugar kinase [Microbacterium sp. zg-Y625]
MTETARPDAHTPAVVTFGETMALVRTTEIGSLKHASTLALGIGGAESNVAIGLRRLGAPVSWLGRVGDDPLGERVLREIRGEGVTVHGIVDADAPTGLMIKARPSSSSSAVHYYRAGSAGSRLAPTDLPAGWVEGASILHITGITPLLSPSAREAARDAVDRARVAGVTVSFDINYRSALADPAVAEPVLRDIAERADIIFGDAAELGVLYPDATPADAAARLMDAGTKQVVLKLGPEGAATSTSSERIESPGFVVDVIDTVGAGDAFVAGYLSAHLAGLDLRSTLLRANACGAMACQVPGDWEAAPTLQELERFLEGGDPVRR